MLEKFGTRLNSVISNAEAFPHAVDNRQKGGDVRGVARPHLTANRATLHIYCHAYDHLLQIRSVILSVAALADRLSTAAFEIKGSGVEKDQFHFGK